MVNEGAPTKVSELNENRFYGASDRQIVPKDLAGSVGNHLFKPADARIYIGIKVEAFQHIVSHTTQHAPEWC